MAEFSNREIATAIIFAVLLVVSVVVPNLRRTVGKSFAAVLRALLAWKLVLLFALYAVYTATLVAVAHHLGGWHRDQLKDTVLIAVFYGVPLLMSATKVHDEGQFLRSTASRILGLSAIVGFYLSLESLPLWGELIFQPIAALIAMTAVVANHSEDDRSASVGRLLNRCLVLMGVSLFVFTTWRAVTVWDAARATDALASFGLSVWLGIALVPFVYAAAYQMSVGQILVVLPFFNDRTKPPLGVRAAVATGLRGSTGMAEAFTGEWRREVARSRRASDARHIMKKFRSNEKRKRLTDQDSK